MNSNNSQNSEKNNFMLNREQLEVYNWLKKQELNTDDNTLNFWSRKYPAKRLTDVVTFAISKRNSGQSIYNIGGWIHKMLKTDAPVVNKESQTNQEYTRRFIKEKKWDDLKIYEKYVKDDVTGDDLPLTRPEEDFRRELVSLYQRSILYKNL
jgi:hypothetical protein